MTEQFPEPTGDDVPDGTQIPLGGDEEPNQDLDAGVGDAEIEYDEDVFADGDA